MTPWLLVRNETSAPAAEILIQGRIGKDWWDGSGMAVKEFTDALKSIPVGRQIIIGINSEGGSVKDGLGMYNAIKQRASDVTSRIDGYALSIASIVALGAGKVISPRSAVWMIHEPWADARGNAEELRKAADMLDTHGKMLAEIYAAETGKTPDEMRAAMTKETWIQGADAVGFGLADESDDGPVALNCIDLSRFKNPPTNIFRFGVAAGADGGSTAANQKDDTMKKLLAALAEAGLIPSADLNEDAAVTAFATAFGNIRSERDKLKADNHSLTEQVSAARKAEVEAFVQSAVDAKRITADVKSAWVTQIIGNDGARALLNAIQATKAQAGIPPVPQQTPAGSTTETKAKKASDVWGDQFKK